MMDGRRDLRGQVALEFIFLVGLVTLIVITAYPVLQQQVELNKALSAARDGAVYGSSFRGLSYYTSGTSPSNRNPPGVIKLTQVTLISQGVEEGSGRKMYQIKINARGPEYLMSYENTIEASIRNYARSYAYHAFYGRYQGGFSPVYTNNYKFTFSANLSSNGG
jgi:hypothetical protein